MEFPRSPELLPFANLDPVLRGAYPMLAPKNANTPSVRRNYTFASGKTLQMAELPTAEKILQPGQVVGVD